MEAGRVIVGEPSSGDSVPVFSPVAVLVQIIHLQDAAVIISDIFNAVDAVLVMTRFVSSVIFLVQFPYCQTIGIIFIDIPGYLRVGVHEES